MPSSHLASTFTLEVFVNILKIAFLHAAKLTMQLNVYVHFQQSIQITIKKNPHISCLRKTHNGLVKSHDMCTKPHRHVIAYFNQEILSNSRNMDLNNKTTPVTDFDLDDTIRVIVSFPSFAIYNKVHVYLLS